MTDTLNTFLNVTTLANVP